MLTDAGMNSAIQSDPQLGANTIGSTDQHRIPEPGRLQVERSSKPTNLAIRPRSSSRLDDGLDGVDQSVAIINRDTGSGISQRVVGRGSIAKGTRSGHVTIQFLRSRIDSGLSYDSPMSDIPPDRLSLKFDRIDSTVS